MTQDEIIEIARQAGFFVKDNDAYSPSVQEDHELTPFLVAFANLVAAKEREACAKMQEPVAWMQITKYGNKLLAFTEPPLEPPCYTGEFIAAKNYPLFLKKENT